MDKIAQTLAWLDAAGVSYELMEHPPAATMEDIHRLGIDQKGLVCKNLFLRDSHKGKRHFLVSVCGDKPVDLKQLGATLGDRLSFASEQRLMKFLQLEQGSVTPLGVQFDTQNAVSVVLDEELLQHPLVGVHPCVNTATVFLAPNDLASLIQEKGNTLRWAAF